MVPTRVLSWMILSVGLTAALPTDAQEDRPAAWPQFRGPNASGIDAGSGSTPHEFGPSKNLLWKTDLPSGHSSPAIWGTRIFLTAFDDRRKTLEVIALDKATGHILWRRPVAAQELEKVHEVSSPATATPTVDGERVYAYFGSYGLVAYDMNGTMVWELPMPVVAVANGSGTSPIVEGELVILNRHDPKDPFRIAVDRKTGRVVWKHPHVLVGKTGASASSHSTPVIAQQQIIVHGPAFVEGFDVSTGVRRWWVAQRSTGASTPTVAGDTAYVATWYPLGESDQFTPLPDFPALLKYDRNGNETLSADEIPLDMMIFERPDLGPIPNSSASVRGSFSNFDSNSDGQIDKDEWAAGAASYAKRTTEHGVLAVKLGGTGDVTATHVRWKERSSVPEVPSPLVYRDRVYLVRNGGILSCLDAASGTLVYRTRVGAGGPYYASPIAVNGRIIVASGEGTISVVNAGDRFDVVAQNSLGEPIFATPAVVESVLYIRTASTLWAFGERRQRN